MIRVAIVGLGGISGAHLNAYKQFPERCKIVALCDIVPEKAQKRAKEFGLECDIVDDHHKLLDRKDIDLVDICTPPYVHAEISINALNAGFNVVCEKPMAASLEECDRVIAAAKKNGKLFSSIAQNRFLTSISAFKKTLDSGLAGEVKHFQVDSFWWRGHCYYDMWWRGTWEKEGGGCTLNHAVHHIDMLGWMMGMPDEINSVMTNVSHDNAEVEDLSVSVMRFGRALATVTASVVHHGEKQALTAQCADASISVPFSTYASVSKQNGFPTEKPELEKKLTEAFESAPKLKYEGHPGQIDNILTCLENGSTTPAVTGEDGRRTIEIITGIYKSGSTHQSVKLPLAKDDPFYTVKGIRESAPHYYEKTRSEQDLGNGAISVEAIHGGREAK